MHRALFLVIALSSLAALLLPAAAARGANYESRQNHFSFVLPPDWQRIPSETLRNAGGGIGAKSGAQAPECEAGFAKTAGLFASGTSFMLVQFIPVRTSLDSIERELKQMVQKSGGTGVQSAKLDRSRNLITIESTMNDGGQAMRRITYGFIGKNGVTNLHCYAPAAMFNRELPTFQGFAHSFAYDSGYEYKGGSGGRTGRTAGIGLVVLAAAWVIRKVRKAA